MRIALDTSVLVAALCGWHERHAAAAAAIESALARGDRLVLPAHCLAETYAVLTRLPSPHRLSPRDALRLIDGNLALFATIAGLPPDGYPALLRRLARAGVAGGRTYDALVLAAARRARVAVLWTFNLRDFAGIGGNVRVEVPGA